MTGEAAIALVDKPAGCTSHDVVARARRQLGTRKVGHGGTLDPDATGLLVLGVGRGTRLLTFVSGLDKSYTGEMVLGVETDTLDAAGTVTATHDMAAVTASDVAAAAESFVGAIEQVPPMVSAVRVGGRRLHQLAREGQEVEREPRSVRIDRLSVRPTADPAVHRIEVDCSSGTYIRSLVADIGAALGGGAHLRRLRRIRVGRYRIDEADPVDAIVARPAGRMLPHLPVAVVDADTAAAVAHGKVLDVDRLGVAGSGPWQVHDDDGRLLAVYQLHGEGRGKPACVLV